MLLSESPIGTKQISGKHPVRHILNGRGVGPFVVQIAPLWRDSGASAASFRALALADVFSSMNLNRQSALWAIKKLKDSPLPLFAGISSAKKNGGLTSALLPTVSLWQTVFQDYQRTGLSLKAHPLSFARAGLDTMGVLRAADLKDPALAPNNAEALVCGMVLVRQRPLTASGVVFMIVEDESGTVNVIIKARIFESFIRDICDSTFVLTKGKVQRHEGVLHLIAESVEAVDEMMHNYPSFSRDFH